MKKLLLTLSLLFMSSAAYAQTSTKGIQYTTRASIPCDANTSCMWIDTATLQVQFYDGTTAKTVPSVVATTKGDIAVWNGTTWVKLAAGNNGEVLSAQSGASSGLQWATVSASTGNWTFSGNVADLTGAGAMTLGGTNATSIVLDENTSLSSGKTLGLTGLITNTINSIGAALSPGALLTNTTAASTGAQQWTPAIELRGHRYTGATDKVVGWNIQGISSSDGADPGVLRLCDHYDGTDCGKAGLDIYDFGGGTTAIRSSVYNPSGFVFSTSVTVNSGGEAFVPATSTYNLGSGTTRWAEVWERHDEYKQAAKPTCAVGAGAGTGSPSCSVTTHSTDARGTVTVTLGTTPTAGATLVTVTFGTTFTGSTVNCTVAPANAAASDNPTMMPFVGTTTATTMPLTTPTVAYVSGAPAFTWNCAGSTSN